MANKKNSTRKGQQPGRVLFSISWGGVVAVSLFMIIAMAWAFILGVMLGRGYQPEAIVPQIAKVMPSSERPVSEPEKQPILKPEELGFFERLKDEPPKPEPSPKRQVTRPVTRPEPSRTTSKPAATPTRSVVFQVGAVRDSKGAKQEQARMSRLGLDASISPVIIRGTQWYRILVPASGTTGDIDAVKVKLAKAGVKNPIIRNK